eukprot:comp17659_c0_seq1/m.17450 comp17659_c0_seq1/g.17450  ORF comp17659_c0_seq1/g.17450 comp17659_c0_seq1/m.17450 type:complete len:868 (-) comp17659_c0_seq1:184-2787(-)
MVTLEDDVIIVLALCLCILAGFMALLVWQLRRKGYFGKTVVVDVQGDGTQRIEMNELVSVVTDGRGYTAVPASYKVGWDEIELGPILGRGSYGIVYKAKYRGTTVAVKKLLRQSYDDRTINTFEQEFKMLGDLRHPNIVLFMGACLVIPNMAIITEYLPRGSLHTVLADPAIQIGISTRIQIVSDICRGMNYLHSNKPPIVHRDLKSPNLLVNQNFSIKVSDFGLTVLLENSTDSKNGAVFAGSIPWGAPEVLKGAPATEQSDVYSFGIVLWEILTRRKLYEGIHPMSIGYQVIRKDLRPRPIPEEPSELMEMVSLMKECWDTNPLLRPGFPELMRRVEVFQENLSVENTPSGDVGGHMQLQDIEIEGPAEGMLTAVLHVVEDSSGLWETYPSVMRTAVEMHNAEVRSLIRVHEGYENRLDPETFMVIFSNPIHALSWALETQECLIELPWPPEVLAMRGCEPVSSNQHPDQLLYSGLRVGHFIITAPMEREKDASTGRWQYRGKATQMLPKLRHFIQGGQILVTNDLALELREAKHAELMAELVVRDGGQLGDSRLYEILPQNLAERTFKRPVLTEAEMANTPEIPQWDFSLRHWGIERSDIEISDIPLAYQSHGQSYLGRWGGCQVMCKKFNEAQNDDDHLSCRAEVTMRMRLRHPNVNQFLGVVLDGDLIMVTEYMPLGTLEDVLRQPNVAIGPMQRLSMVRHIARALYYLHTLRPPILHLNVQPAAILVDENFELKLSDFGFANVMHDPGGVFPRVTTGHAHIPIERLYYVSPEILRGEKATDKSDVYSFGMLSMVILTRQLAWDLVALLQVTETVATGRKSALASRLSRPMAAMINACCRADPLERPKMIDVLQMINAEDVV